MKGEDENEKREHLKYKIKYELIPLMKEYVKDGMFTKRKKIIAIKINDKEKKESLVEALKDNGYEKKLLEKLK